MAGVGLGISHLLSKTISVSVQKKVEKDVNEKNGRKDVITPDDFSKPRLESSLTRDGNGTTNDMPTTIEDVYVEKVNVRLDQKRLLEQTHSKEKEIEATKAVATKLASTLDEEIIKVQGKKSFASNREDASFIMQIEIYAVSTGNRLSRFLQIGEGHVLLEVGYSLKGNNKIIKHGRTRYVDTLAKSSNLMSRCSKNSGEDALLAVLPTIAQQLKQEIDVNSPEYGKRISDMLEIS